MKTKSIKEEGQMLSIPDDKAPAVIEITQAQAKRLMKREMTEKQKLHINNLIEKNKIKWEAKKQEKAEQLKKASEVKAETETIVYVKPKRVYPPRKKETKSKPKPQDHETDDEVEDENDESDEEYQISKTSKKIEMKAKALEKIDATLQKIAPVNKYLEMLKAKSRW
jgi:hypothetical protein